jgi:hypothetical protein
MSPSDVERVLGAPNSVLPSHFGDRIEQRPHLSLAFSKDQEALDEAVFTRGVNLLFHGRNLFAEPDLVATLRHSDPQPYLFVGFIIFNGIGVRLSGFLPDDESEQAIGLVRTGHWREYANEFVPLPPQ